MRNGHDVGFDVAQFVKFLRDRWLTIAFTCGIAAFTALAVSLLMPNRYTATASILIRPPAGLDPRAVASVSQVYLESLKTYEEMASSDSLFLRALEHLGIRQRNSTKPIESLKRSVLKVSKPVSTKVIEVSATLEDPRQAQALAQYIAEQTVALSRSLDSQYSQDLAKESESILEKARIRLASAQKASEEVANGPAPEALAAEIENGGSVKFRVESDLSAARTELIALTAGPAGSGDSKASERAAQVATIRARVSDLEARNRELVSSISAAGARIALAKQRHDAVEAELRAARSDFEAAHARVSDIRADSLRGEHLEVFDPGITPQRPSSPNTPLNVIAALLIAAIASVCYLAFRFGYEQNYQSVAERTYSLR